MTRQTFPTEKRPRVVVAQINGSLNVQAWDRRDIAVETSGYVGELRQEGYTLIIANGEGDIALWVPAERKFGSTKLKGITDISVTQLSGHISLETVKDVSAKGIGGSVHLQDIHGDVELEGIQELAEIVGCGGDLSAARMPALRMREGVGGDASLADIAHIEISAVGGDLTLARVEVAEISAVGGDLDAHSIHVALHAGNIGGDCQVQESGNAEVIVRNVGGDAEVSGAGQTQVGNVGGDGDLRDVRGDARLGNIGGDVCCRDIGGHLHIANIGGDAELQGVPGGVEAGNIGGDLDLLSTFPAGSHTTLRIGGDATIVLPGDASLNLRAIAGGDISAPMMGAGGGAGGINLVYGEGAARLELMVGGDLTVRGVARRLSGNMG
ncbi:MAG: DUF4097 domain-containing protein [Chloroflexota bacterium]|nr:DUF4097 domain-containing protein [Chloroflexota bacterium]